MNLHKVRTLCLVVVIALGWQVQAGEQLKVLNYNVLHGFHRAQKLYDEEENKQRLAEQAQAMIAVDPDLVILTELNPIDEATEFLAQQLDMDAIRVQQNCGFKMGPIRKPKGLSEGIAILAKKELQLKKLGTLKLRGPDGRPEGKKCYATKARKYALYGELRHDRFGRTVVVAVHLSAQGQPLSEDFYAELDRMLESGTIDAEERENALAVLSKGREQRRREIDLLVELTSRLQQEYEADSLLLAGDFNMGENSAEWQTLINAGVVDLAKGSSARTWNPQVNTVIDAFKAIRKKDRKFRSRDVQRLYDGGFWTGARRIDHFFAVGSMATPPSSISLFRPTTSTGTDLSDHFGLIVEYQDSARTSLP